MPVSVAFTRLDSGLDLGRGGRADIGLDAVSFAVGVPLRGAWTSRLAAGYVTDGALRPTDGSRHDFDGGMLVAVGFDRASPVASGFLDQLDLTVALSAVWADTRRAADGVAGDYRALDLRLGARAVKRLGRAGAVYAEGRIFGGPVTWTLPDDELTGSDENHYRLGFGTSWRAGPAALFAEAAPLGEQGFSAGLAVIW